jgi:hypothetical protein
LANFTRKLSFRSASRKRPATKVNRDNAGVNDRFEPFRRVPYRPILERLGLVPAADVASAAREGAFWEQPNPAIKSAPLRVGVGLWGESGRAARGAHRLAATPPITECTAASRRDAISPNSPPRARAGFEGRRESERESRGNGE